MEQHCAIKYYKNYLNYEKNETSEIVTLSL